MISRDSPVTVSAFFAGSTASPLSLLSVFLALRPGGLFGEGRPQPGFHGGMW